MHVVHSIYMILMLLSYVFQKTGRLTFEEKCKLLEFMGMIVRETVFPPLVLCKSDTKCTNLLSNQGGNTSNNNLNLVCIDTPTTKDQLKLQP